MFRWGFNRFGQLGLGEGSGSERGWGSERDRGLLCTKASNMLLNPHRVALFPGRASLVSAAANSSAALREEDGMLFTWGSGESGRLGHTCVSDEEQSFCVDAAPVYKPLAVSGLRGRLVANMTLNEEGGFAFVPSSVDLVEPPLLPISGGMKVILRGGGFWDSADCVVKFVPAIEEGAHTSNFLPRSSVGKYIAPEIGHGLEKNNTPGIICKLPRFSAPCDVFVEVAMNGKDFTSNCVRVQLYQEPVLNHIKPICCSCTSTTKLDILGSYLFETGLIKVRFKERGGFGREWVEPGSIYTSNGGLNEGVLSEEDGTVSCRSPLVSGGEFPIEARISVALNGVDFVTLQGTMFVIHNAAVSYLTPDCRPLLLNTPIEPDLNEYTVQIKGQSFFRSRVMLVRFRVEHEGCEVFYNCNANYLDRRSISFSAPTISELLALHKSDDPVSGSSDDDIVDDDVFVPGGMSPDQRSWFCGVQLSLNGTDFLDGVFPFVLYGDFHCEEIDALGPMSGPSSGGSRITFRLPSWFTSCDKSAWPEYRSAIVRLHPTKNSAKVEALTTPASRELIPIRDIEPTGVIATREQYQIGVSFVTPVFKLEANSANVIDAGTLNPDNSFCGTLESERREEHVDDKPPLRMTQDSMVPRRAELRLEIALDGDNFRPLCKTNFTYYATPAVSHLKTNIEPVQEAPVAKLGTEISIYGIDFFDSDSVKVKLARNSKFGSGDANVVLVDATCAGCVIKFTTPELLTDAEHLNFSSMAGGLPESAIQTEIRVVVEVSFNNVDFSNNACWFAYQCQ